MPCDDPAAQLKVGLRGFFKQKKEIFKWQEKKYQYQMTLWMIFLRK